MNPVEFFEANLSLIEQVIARVCRRAGIRDEDAEDFASMAKLALIEDDYFVLRAYEGRSALGTYLTVVVQRFLSRERAHSWGRWHASTEAERLGPAAVLLEKLLVRDGRALEETIPLVRAVDPSLDRTAVYRLVDALPQRTQRLRIVPLPDGHDHVAAGEQADAAARQAEARRMSERAGRVVRETLAGLSLEDRMLMRLRFGAELSIADTSRLLGAPQRPLYRRVEALLRLLRDALEREGVGASLVEDVISAAASEGVDFGLHQQSAENFHTGQLEEQG